MATKFNLSLIASVIVTCMQPSGYRRAGLNFEQGKNTFSIDGLDEQQLEAIENDARLSMQIVPHDESTAAQGQLDADNVDSTVKLYEHVDFTQAEPALQPIIAVMIDAQMELKPTVDQLTYEAPGENDGEVIKVKVSAKDRDAAWQWLQDAAKGEGE
ncbi:HI1506-related protein [Pseudoalteromonas sp.]|uniref:HI1506-related protein n=1 Tax=Pseudoalteromonas sp. TaxID=53249 RepID=UPI002729FB33|nr:HI1506-related protein [Pseudoalteromonas sp.]